MRGPRAVNFCQYDKSVGSAGGLPSDSSNLNKKLKFYINYYYFNEMCKQKKDDDKTREDKIKKNKE
jgi:hypothetical protein